MTSIPGHIRASPLAALVLNSFLAAISLKTEDGEPGKTKGISLTASNKLSPGERMPELRGILPANTEYRSQAQRHGRFSQPWEATGCRISGYGRLSKAR